MENYKKTIIDMIANKSGAEHAEINDESFFEDDLNVGDLEFTELIEEVEEKYEIDLSEFKGDIETVEDLISAVAENLE